MGSRRAVPRSVEELRDRLEALRASRRAQKASTPKRRRSPLNAAQRAAVLEKTSGRCHVCGGLIGKGPWHADHVLSHSRAGSDGSDNFLPAHPLCNNYRWDYLPEEFEIILKLGVWARTQIERGTQRGESIAEGFLAHERQRARR